MGVMVLAPANNFERHMLPITFVFFFTVLMFIRDSVYNTCRQSDKINCDLAHDNKREDSHNNTHYKTHEDSHKN